MNTRSIARRVSSLGVAALLTAGAVSAMLRLLASPEAAPVILKAGLTPISGSVVGDGLFLFLECPPEAVFSENWNVVVLTG